MKKMTGGNGRETKKDQVTQVFFVVTLPKTNSSPLKVGRNPKGNEKVFQPSIFRCERLLVSGRVNQLPNDFGLYTIFHDLADTIQPRALATQITRSIHNRICVDFIYQGIKV